MTLGEQRCSLSLFFSPSRGYLHRRVICFHAEFSFFFVCNISPCKWHTYVYIFVFVEYKHLDFFTGFSDECVCRWFFCTCFFIYVCASVLLRMSLYDCDQNKFILLSVYVSICRLHHLPFHLLLLHQAHSKKFTRFVQRYIFLCFSCNVWWLSISVLLLFLKKKKQQHRFWQTFHPIKSKDTSVHSSAPQTDAFGSSMFHVWFSLSFSFFLSFVLPLLRYLCPAIPPPTFLFYISFLIYLLLWTSMLWLE